MKYSKVQSFGERTWAGWLIWAAYSYFQKYSKVQWWGTTRVCQRQLLIRHIWSWSWMDRCSINMCATIIIVYSVMLKNENETIVKSSSLPYNGRLVLFLHIWNHVSFKYASNGSRGDKYNPMILTYYRIGSKGCINHEGYTCSFWGESFFLFRPLCCFFTGIFRSKYDGQWSPLKYGMS